MWIVKGDSIKGAGFQQVIELVCYITFSLFYAAAAVI